MNNTEIGAANDAAPKLPTSAELSDRLSLLSTERDKAEKLATGAHNAIRDCNTGAAIQKAVGDATSAANKHETLIRACERVESELAAATSRESEEEKARQLVEFEGFVVGAARQAHAQKLVFEETLAKLSEEVSDKILNAIDELNEAKSAHAKTVGIYNGLKSDVCRRTVNNQGQTFIVPQSQDPVSGLVFFETTETDYDREQRAFNTIFSERGIDIKAVDAVMSGLKSTATFGVRKFVFELSDCKWNRRPLRAEFSNVAPVVPIEYSSTTTHGYGNTDATANADPGPERLTNPELFVPVEADRQPATEDVNPEQARQQRIKDSSEILYRSDVRATEW